MIEVTQYPLSAWRSQILSFNSEILVNRLPAENFLIGKEQIGSKTLTEYYIPFSGINQNAKIIIAGLTPGYTQWINAVNAAKSALEQGLSDEEVLEQAKLTGAFSGELRKLFVEQLDAVGFHRAMGVETSGAFFDNPGDIHLTSVFVHPIFVDDKGLNSVGKLLERSTLMRESIINGFAEEAAVLSDAVIFPLGRAAASCCRWLVENGKLDADRVLAGLQHPSPANRARILYFCGKKTREEMRGANKPEPIDADKAAFLAAMKRRFG